MRSRTGIVTAAVLALLFAAPSYAFAWANGYQGDGYGTHDWVLEEALILSGESWVDTQVALLATDDPDYDYPIEDHKNHVFRPEGDGRGAPQTVLDLYHQAVTAYGQGDMVAASQYLGLLSHYYSDICVPYHVASVDDSTSDEHLAYELDVDDRTGYSRENADWITPVARKTVVDVRQNTVDAALSTRSTYPAFYTAYRSSGWGSSTVQSVTKASLSRAVNDLADIIQSIPNGTGIPEAGTVAASSLRTNVGKNTDVVVYAKVTDDSGNPVEGARVVYEWKLPQGTITDVEYTMADGVAESWENLGNVPLGADFEVVAVTTSGADSASDAVTFHVTDKIGYIQTTVPYYDPMQNTLVTASCVILNEYGEPIPGLDVKFTWEHKTTTHEYLTTTDQWGVARHARNIGASAVGHVVTVRAETQAGGSNRSSYATFRPKANTGDRTNYSRIYGSDRFSTAAAISRRAFPHGSEVVIIATGMNWPDALGGSALAGAHDAPILLSNTNSLPPSIKDEIRRLGATRAYILGGKASVDTGVEKDLKSVGVRAISRIAGSNRYEAARNIARSVQSNRGSAYEGVAFVSSGATFPDALAASPIAAFRKWPIYLADPKAHPSTLASQMKSDGVREVIILGGPASVSTAYENKFKATFRETTRLGGRNRYDAAANIAQYGVENAGLGWDGVNVASGGVFPDALAGGALANQKRCVLLLTDGKKLSPEPKNVLSLKKDEIGTVLYLGGSATLTNDVRKRITATLE